MTVSVGKAAGSSVSWSVNHLDMVCSPWSVSMLVYMETASDVKSLAFGGKRPRFVKSSSIWFESLVWLGQRVTTSESW